MRPLLRSTEQRPAAADRSNPVAADHPRRRWSVQRLGQAAVVAALVVAGLVGADAPAARADSIRDALWHLDALDMTTAWATSKGAGVTVAVIDTGVDGSQQDLAGTVLAGTNLAGPGDGNTIIGTHGTAMAGLIAAHGPGADGMLGIAPEASILPVVQNDSRTAAKAVRWAADNGADVINCSFESQDGRDTPELRKAIAYALSKDVVVVAGAGNSGASVGFPGAYDGLISVSGLSKTDTLTPLSASGPEVDLAAPAEDITSTGPGDTYLNSPDGTSNAAAIVSGVAALVRAAYPDLDAANVVNRVISTARDLGPPGRDDEFGYGAVDPVAALAADVPAVDANPLGVLDPPGGAAVGPTAAPTEPSAAATPSPSIEEGAAVASSPSATCDRADAGSVDCPAVATADTDAGAGSLLWTIVGAGVALVLGSLAWRTVGRRAGTPVSGSDAAAAGPGPG